MYKKLGVVDLLPLIVHVQFSCANVLKFMLLLTNIGSVAVAIGILLLALLGFAYRYHPISPTRQTVRLSDPSPSITAIDCRSTPQCSVPVYGPFILAMTTTPNPAWRELHSSSITQVTLSRHHTILLYYLLYCDNNH